MKTFPYIIIAILIVLLFFKDCTAKTEKKQVVTVPKIEAKLPTKKPEHTQIRQNDFRQKLSKIEKSKNDIPTFIYVKNDSLLNEYEKENDSLKKLLLFKKVIQLNKFNTKFEDENLILNIEGIVQGEIEEITPSYIIKQKAIEINEKEVKFRILAGVEVGNTLLFDKPLFKASIAFQNKKGNIIAASYDSEKRIYIGYNFTLFTVKK